MCGSVVVLSDTGNNSDVYARDLSGALGGGSVIQVATTSDVEAYPACDGSRVVCMYSPVGGQADIRLYDLATGQTQVVSAELWNEWRPAISGNRVVWQAWPTQPDTTEGQEIPADTCLSGTQQAPSIFGRRLVFQGDASGPWNVYIGNRFFYTG